MKWLRAGLITVSFAMLIGAGIYIFYSNILPGLKHSNKSAQLVIPLTGCLVEENRDFETTLLRQINTERITRGLPTLSTDARLYQAAAAHSQDMGCGHFFNHINLQGLSLYDRIKEQGYIYAAAAEVIYAGNGPLNSPEEAFQAWLKSPGQKTQLLNSIFTQVGISAVYSQGSPYGGYFTVVFASPAH
jgi:uncharacterized protein YkwD